MRRGNDVKVEADREDRLQRALQENYQLKHTVHELQEKLKHVQVKFHKLTNDLKRVSPEIVQQLNDNETLTSLPKVRPATSGGIKSNNKFPINRSLPSVTTLSTTTTTTTTTLPQTKTIINNSAFGNIHNATSIESEELKRTREALQRAQLEIESLRNSISTAPGISTTTASPAISIVLEQLRGDLSRAVAERDRLRMESESLREQLTRTRAELESIRISQQQHHSFERHSYDVLNERAQTAENVQRQSEREYQQTIEKLTREKDELMIKLRILQQEDSDRNNELTSINPISLIQLQNEVNDKSKQITILTSRIQGAQQQAETLKNECTRLVDELKRFHSMHAETKRQLFEVEHEKGLLQVRCARVEELEIMLQRKSEELLRTEQELLRTAGTLHSCNRETEEAVRRELSSRIADLQEMRDTAESRRREKESQLINAQQQISELRRQLEVARDDAAMYREQQQKTEKDRAELATRAAIAGHSVEEFGDEAVRRALAVAGIRKNRISNNNNNNNNNIESESKEALDMWDALQWDDGWEADQLREALASAALDMELAETRCTQMSAQIEQTRDLLQKVSEERDILLEENIEMRRRLTHVQTVFAKQQLDAYRVAKECNNEVPLQDGLITFNIRDLECNDGLLRTLGIGNTVGAAVALFFTLDGLDSYDTMLSPTFYSLDDPLDIRFRYDNLDRDEVTVGLIRSTTFVFQLHQVHGTSNTIVAMGKLPGSVLLACRECTVTEEVPLCLSDGSPAGAIALEISASHLLLPIFIDRPLREGGVLSTEAARAALLALRGVIALRVRVFRAAGLPAGPPPPQPYVFYTTRPTPAGEACGLRDTAVRPTTPAPTTDPVFEAEPTDHKLTVDRDLVEFIATGAIVFVVFDEKAKEVQANLGVVEVPLRPLLTSPQAVVQTTQPLHPQGTLSVGISWVCRM